MIIGASPTPRPSDTTIDRHRPAPTNSEHGLIRHAVWGTLHGDYAGPGRFGAGVPQGIRHVASLPLDRGQRDRPTPVAAPGTGGAATGLSSLTDHVSLNSFQRTESIITSTR